MNNELINIKGTKNGLIFYFNTSAAKYEELKQILCDKLENSHGFFTGASFSINTENTLTSTQIIELENICLDHGMVKSTPQPFVHSGKAIKNTSTVEGEVIRYQAEPTADAVLINKSLRSGQKIYTNGHTIVLGDINAGAEIISTGSVVVLGTLRGIAHAGSQGDTSAFILAYRLQPTQIRIADRLGRAPENASDVVYPEIAKIIDHKIVIEPYGTTARKAANQ